MPGRDLQALAARSRSRGTQRVGHVADRDHDRDRHAALARRAVRGAHGRVGRELEIGVRQHDHVVLRAAERLHALAGRVPVS